VHRQLGCGLFESIYRRALAIEFDAARDGLLINFDSRLLKDGVSRKIV